MLSLHTDRISKKKEKIYICIICIYIIRIQYTYTHHLDFFTSHFQVHRMSCLRIYILKWRTYIMYVTHSSSCVFDRKFIYYNIQSLNHNYSYSVDNTK